MPGQTTSQTKLEKLLYPLRSGKNSKLRYFTGCAFQFFIPRALYRRRLNGIIEDGLRRYGEDALMQRVDYYNKLESRTPLPEDAQRLSEHRMGRKGQVYFFDTNEYLRYFPQNLLWSHIPGDVTIIPPVPSIVKSRPVAGDNANSVILNLNKVRHFLFVHSDIPFAQKDNTAVFRGKVRAKQKRIELFRKHFDNPLCDLGDTSSKSGDPEEWKTGKLTLAQQLQYKFVLAIEGNDVASNLKWVMSSNSIAIMPRPEYETWFMEDRLVPGVHYIETAPDYSDLSEKIAYYASHESEAQEIIRNAHEYVAQFRDRRRENLISLLVLRKYFELTN